MFRQNAMRGLVGEHYFGASLSGMVKYHVAKPWNNWKSNGDFNRDSWKNKTSNQNVGWSFTIFTAIEWGNV
jgi:hypothetical protein